MNTWCSLAVLGGPVDIDPAHPQGVRMAQFFFFWKEEKASSHEEGNCVVEKKPVSRHLADLDRRTWTSFICFFDRAPIRSLNTSVAFCGIFLFFCCLKADKEAGVSSIHLPNGEVGECLKWHRVRGRSTKSNRCGRMIRSFRPSIKGCDADGGVRYVNVLIDGTDPRVFCSLSPFYVAPSIATFFCVLNGLKKDFLKNVPWNVPCTCHLFKPSTWTRPLSLPFTRQFVSDKFLKIVLNLVQMYWNTLLKGDL